MKFRQKFRDFVARLKSARLYTFLIVSLLVFVSLSVFQAKTSAEYKESLDAQYIRAFDDLAEYVSTIETSLYKCAAVTDAKSVVRLASSIYAKASSASACLGQLPLSDTNLENTARFLAQVGDFSSALALRYMDTPEITESDRQNMVSLSRYAETLENALYDMQAQLYDGKKSFGMPKKRFGETFAQSMEKLETEFQEYPALIYDGPFSDHVEDKPPRFLEGQAEISPQEAKTRLSAFVPSSMLSQFSEAEEMGGGAPCYVFTASVEEGRTVSYYITKQGGHLLEMLDSRTPTETKISLDKAKELSKVYLERLGFSAMQDSYYEVHGNIATVNFAYSDGKVLYYPDLIKVRVAMDNGEILGMEAGGYMANHGMRAFPSPTVTPENAQKRLSPLLSPQGVQLCVIPLNSGAEALCWEFKCKMEERTFLVYLDALAGHEQDILMLLENEDGMLTI